MIQFDFKDRSQLIKISAGILASILVIAVVFLIDRKRLAQKNNPESEVESLVAELSEHMQLPDEKPTIATVTDKNLLSQQEFFDNSQNGDKLVIYENWKKAIIYRPETKKVINFTSINPEPEEGQVAGSTITATPTPTPVPGYRVALLNGSTINGLTQEAANQLNPVKSVSIVARENAVASTYTQTLVIPVKESSRSMATNIAKLLSGQVSTLPEGERMPQNTDILVILGAPPATTVPTPKTLISQ